VIPPDIGVNPRIVDKAESRLSGTSRGTNADRRQLRVNAKKPPPRFDPGGGISPWNEGMLAGSWCEESRKRFGWTLKARPAN
jgi:hypothetical protein